MGVPKRRVSKQRKRQRQANIRIEAPQLIRCPQCHALTRPHQVCLECGHYKSKKVIDI